MSRARLVDYMKRNEYAFSVDDDGDITGMWDGRFYVFMLRDDDAMLQIRSRWQRASVVERLEPLLEACNMWNGSYIWPKSYVRVHDDGSIGVYTEHSNVLEAGVTDEQLEDLIDCAIGTSGMFFDHLDERFPDPIKEAS